MTLEKLLNLKEKQLKSHELVVLCKEAVSRCLDTMFEILPDHILEDLFLRKKYLYQGTINFVDVGTNDFFVMLDIPEDDRFYYPENNINMPEFEGITIDFYEEIVRFTSFKVYDEWYLKMLFKDSFVSHQIVDIENGKMGSWFGISFKFFE